MGSDDESETFEDLDPELVRDPSEPDMDVDVDQDDDQDADGDEQDMDAEEESEGEEGSGEGEEEEEEEDEDGDENAGSGDEQEEDEEPDEETGDVSSPERVTQRTSPAEPGRETTPVLTSLSPEQARRSLIAVSIPPSRSFTIEPVAAIPHPCATHCLASSLCMSHLLTGSQDGYVRNYDVFASCNGKVFLTAPQRTHCGLGDSNIKAGALRFWWEGLRSSASVDDNVSLSPIYSMALHSDALWCLTGNAEGNIGLYTVRHSPGNLVHVLQGHRNAVSAMALSPDERGLFSAGWDHIAIQWDLDTGQQTRQFQGHTAQLAAIAVRPIGVNLSNGNDVDDDDDVASNDSYDPLFDSRDDDAASSSATAGRNNDTFTLSLPGVQSSSSSASGSNLRGIQPLTPHFYADYSQDQLLTASIDGQVAIWDRRTRDRAGRLDVGDKIPPWCISACWSADGSQIYVGRRNGTIDVWDMRQTGTRGVSTPRVLKVLRNPPSSGSVTCIAPFPDGKHLACSSGDNIRLWNVQEADSKSKQLGFKIIAGHHGGNISQMMVDRSCRFLITASGDRGWTIAESSKTVLVHEIKRVV